MNERYAAALHDINSNFPAFHTIGARAYRPDWKTPSCWPKCSATLTNASAAYT